MLEKMESMKEEHEYTFYTFYTLASTKNSNVILFQLKIFTNFRGQILQLESSQ